MSIEQVVIGLTSVMCACLGWFARVLFTAVQDLKSDLNKLEVRISTDYVRYDRLQDVMKPVMTKLDRIEEVLMHKQDKP